MLYNGNILLNIRQVEFPHSRVFIISLLTNSLNRNLTPTVISNINY